MFGNFKQKFVINLVNNRCAFVTEFKSPKGYARYFHVNSKCSGFSNGTSGKRIAIAPSPNATPNSNIGWSSLIKPFFFTIGFSGCCFLSASIWQYENMKGKARKTFQNWDDSLFLPKYKRGEIRRQCKVWWDSKTEGQKVAYAIIGINCFVFLLWRFPHLQPFMIRYFCCSPAMKAKCSSMFLSTFSHHSLFHLAANMFVLHSFSTSAVSYFGKEQFVAFYCSAGVISSFVSYLHKVAFARYSVSLGASGALLAVLSSTCIQFPDASLSIVFFPFIVFPAGHAIKVVMALDVIGLIAKWKLLDHAAHLGGAVFGIWYLLYGCDSIWNKREPFMLWWHNLREGK